MRIVSTQSRSFARTWKSFLAAPKGQNEVDEAVREVIAALEKRGDAALLDYTEQWDGIRLRPNELRIPPANLKAAWGKLAAEEKKAIREAASQIKAFHRQTRLKDWQSRNGHGALVGERFYPIQRVGLYIPGGNVPLVSTVLMTAIPARIAGVPSIAVATPPASDGSVSPAILGALYVCGIDEVFRMGGAQAIAAFACGTRTVPKVDLIAGPGNSYVMEAKRQVYGKVGVDLLPGPSEVMVFADGGANPHWIAADLIAQAEHGSGKEKVCALVPSLEMAESIEKETKILLTQLPDMSRASAILRKRGLIVVVDDLGRGIALANEMAPEHLELQMERQHYEVCTRSIQTAGAILQGYFTPTVLGDFVAGPSHTLPTQNAGRFSGGLQVSQFMRRSSILRYGPREAARAGTTVRTFARMEKLEGHGYSLDCRLPTQTPN